MMRLVKAHWSISDITGVEARGLLSQSALSSAG